MPKKIAIDWDDSEIRFVVAQCNGRSVKVTDAAVIPIEDSTAIDTLRAAVARRGHDKCDGLVAIGRGKAELRELQLPPVPDDELPDMVRFQAIRNFASAGDAATVDFLTTERNDTGVSMIAAAVSPAQLNEVREVCESATIAPKRIALRPLCAAALYLTKHGKEPGDRVLVDLLVDDAEIVIARNGKVIFVRTVRLPNAPAARPAALAGELKRSLVACGSDSTDSKVILWGRKAVHEEDVRMLREASGVEVETVDPFDLVDVDGKLAAELPDHVGRLAPLVGLLASDEAAPELLIDFLNPRKRPEPEKGFLKKGLLVGVPAAVVLLLGYLVYNQFAQLENQIEDLKQANNELRPDATAADEKVAKTERIDMFLDADVNWLDEFKRVAEQVPPSDRLVVRNVVATSDPRKGGGRLTFVVGVTDHSVIDEIEASLRDETHSVIGDTFSESKQKDEYKWQTSETIALTAAAVRDRRYELMAPLFEMTDEGTTETSDEAAKDEPAADEPAKDDTGDEPAENDADEAETTEGDSEAEPTDDAKENNDELIEASVSGSPSELVSTIDGEAK